MPHMVAQEHMGYVDALRYGTARNNTTLAAALSAIGSSPATLVVTFAGDGVWTLSANLTVPATVTLLIPQGVTLFRSTGVTLTVNGPILSHSSTWETGPGTTSRGVGAPMEMSAIKSALVQVSSSPSVGGFQFSTAGVTPSPGFTMTTGISGSDIVPFFNLVRDPSTPTSNWVISNNLTDKQFTVSHPGGQAYFAVTNTGSWFGNGSAVPTPTHTLQLSANDAFMPGGGPWGSSSDSRLKTVVHPFAEGLATLQALPDPIVYTYNGKGTMPDDGTEYIGMIADAVQPVAPYMVSTYQAKLDPEDAAPTDLLALNNGAMVYILMNAVRELAARVAALETPLTRASAAAPAVEEEDPPAQAPRPQRKRPS
jgi:hypothetical protein